MRTYPMTEPMTMAEIRARYPDQWVWLHDLVRPHGGPTVTARVVDLPRVRPNDEPPRPQRSVHEHVTYVPILSDEPSYTPYYTGKLDVPPVPWRYFQCSPRPDSKKTGT